MSYSPYEKFQPQPSVGSTSSGAGWVIAAVIVAVGCVVLFGSMLVCGAVGLVFYRSQQETVARKQATVQMDQFRARMGPNGPNAYVPPAYVPPRIEMPIYQPPVYTPPIFAPPIFAPPTFEPRTFEPPPMPTMPNIPAPPGAVPTFEASYPHPFGGPGFAPPVPGAPGQSVSPISP